MALVAFDNTILSVLLFADAGMRRERADRLMRELAEAGEQVLIPAPALAEVLMTPGCDIDEILSTLRRSAYIHIGDFDLRAAVEFAIRSPDAATKSKMKFARQIVAIALTNGARILYTDDDAVRQFAESCGMTVAGTSDLTVPSMQPELIGGQQRSAAVVGSTPVPAGSTPPAEPLEGAVQERRPRERLFSVDRDF